MAASGTQKKECAEGGFEIEKAHAGDYLHYPEVTNFPENAQLEVRVSSNNSNPVKQIEIRQDSPTGTLLGVCDVPYTKGWGTYQTVHCSLTNTAGVKDLYLVFRGDKNQIANLNWFRIKR
jgi:hypothetical protein